MKIVGTIDAEVERDLIAGDVECPDCGGRLRPWGWARRRVVRRRDDQEWRRPRRARCGSCSVTHVLIRADSLLRRRDLVEVIGAALLAKANGVGHRRAAIDAGRPPSTVRGWLRRFSANAADIRVWFTVVAHDTDPMLEPIAPRDSVFGDAVEAIAVAARATSLRLEPAEPWSFASASSRGRLLSNTSWPWAAAL